MDDVNDLDIPFIQATNEGRLLLKCCTSCGNSLHSDASICTQCLSEDLKWKEASGDGCLFSFGIMHQMFPEFAERVPYNVAVVQLIEGPRVFSTVIDCNITDLKIGMKLRVCFENMVDGLRLPQFHPTDV